MLQHVPPKGAATPVSPFAWPLPTPHTLKPNAVERTSTPSRIESAQQRPQRIVEGDESVSPMFSKPMIETCDVDSSERCGQEDTLVMLQQEALLKAFGNNIPPHLQARVQKLCPQQALTNDRGLLIECHQTSTSPTPRVRRNAATSPQRAMAAVKPPPAPLTLASRERSPVATRIQACERPLGEGASTCGGSLSGSLRAQAAVVAANAVAATPKQPRPKATSASPPPASRAAASRQLSPRREAEAVFDRLLKDTETRRERTKKTEAVVAAVSSRVGDTTRGGAVSSSARQASPPRAGAQSPAPQRQKFSPHERLHKEAEKLTTRRHEIVLAAAHHEDERYRREARIAIEDPLRKGRGTTVAGGYRAAFTAHMSTISATAASKAKRAPSPGKPPERGQTSPPKTRPASPGKPPERGQTSPPKTSLANAAVVAAAASAAGGAAVAAMMRGSGSTVSTTETRTGPPAAQPHSFQPSRADSAAGPAVASIIQPTTNSVRDVEAAALAAVANIEAGSADDQVRRDLLAMQNQLGVLLAGADLLKQRVALVEASQDASGRKVSGDGATIEDAVTAAERVATALLGAQVVSPLHLGPMTDTWGVSNTSDWQPEPELSTGGVSDEQMNQGVVGTAASTAPLHSSRSADVAAGVPSRKPPLPPIRETSHSPPRGRNVVTWEIEVDRSDGGRVGVDVDEMTDGQLLVKSITAGDAMEVWNLKHPDQALKAQDQISAVNDKTIGLIEECRTPGRLIMSIRRVE